MLSLNRITNPLHRWYYRFALAGFLPLSVGYILREQIAWSNPLAVLMLGVFPNLLGSFATPFILVILLATRFPGLRAFTRPDLFALLNLFTFLVVLLIEYLHVIFQVGLWDSNDIAASLIGGLASWLLFYLTTKTIKHDSPVVLSTEPL